jgi:exopolysaccharide biosynthesis WecB/TagA/CpsF family protein
MMESITAMPSVTILDVKVSNITGAQALRAIDAAAVGGRQQILAYVNAHTLNLAARHQDLREALGRSTLVMNDGLGLSIAARMRGGRFPENLNGSDFTVRLLELAAARNWGVFLLGGEPGIAETAAGNLAARIRGLHVAGTCHGFTGEDDELLTERVRNTDAKLLIVAFGSPRQEVWLDRNLKDTGALVGVGVGAFLDFTAGKVKRAPQWMNRLGVEWCFRLAQEPQRLWHRYIVGNPVFLLRAWRGRHRDARR